MATPVPAPGRHAGDLGSERFQAIQRKPEGLRDDLSTQLKTARDQEAAEQAGLDRALADLNQTGQEIETFLKENL